MKKETIWNIEDILSIYENELLDLKIDYKDSEMQNRKDIIKENINRQSIKIKELKQCIKWLKNIKQ